MECKNATISSVTIGFDRGTIPCAWVYLEYASGGQGFGGFHLGGPVAHTFIFGILDTLGVDKWEDLKGQACRVVGNDSGIVKIGHYLKDDWFEPKEEFKATMNKWVDATKQEVK